MSQVHDLQYSMNSMFTPSYSIGGLAVLVPVEPLSLDVQSVSPQSASASRPGVLTPKLQASSASAPKPVLPQYHKLKMNYFRKLNVIPIISPEDVLNAKDGEKVPSEKAQLSKSKKPFRSKKDRARDAEDDDANSEFIPSFLPARFKSSEPILIPRRVSSRSPSSLSDEPDEDLQREKEPSKSDVSGACLGARLSVAEEDSPDHFGVFFPSFEP